MNECNYPIEPNPDPAAIADGRDKVINLREAAEMLHVSYPTINRMVNSGDLFAFKVNAGWRTSTAICRQYLAKQMRKQLALWNNKKKR